MAGGRMWIASGDAVLDLRADKLQSVHHWQGCILATEVSREALMGIRVYQVIRSLKQPGVRVNLDFS